MDGATSNECRMGTVLSTGNGLARVTVSKIACAGCGVAGACLASMDGGQDEVVARDPLGVSVGDCVEIGITPAAEIKIAFTLYLVPAICLILGVAAGGWGAARAGLEPTLGSLVTGVLFSGLSLWPARRLARRFGVVPVILRREE